MASFPLLLFVLFGKKQSPNDMSVLLKHAFGTLTFCQFVHIYCRCCAVRFFKRNCKCWRLVGIGHMNYCHLIVLCGANWCQHLQRSIFKYFCLIGQCSFGRRQNQISEIAPKKGRLHWRIYLTITVLLIRILKYRSSVCVVNRL